jgi:hypothetical protein
LTSEAPASGGQIPRLLALRPDAVLVGGQSLAAWAAALGIRPGPPLDPYVTSDIDFLGSRRVARELADKLDAELLVPPAEDPVQVNAAVLLLRDPLGGRILVDFLNAVVGLDASKIRKRALEVEAFGTVFRVMHPIDCLESRVANLHLLPSKRNEIGVAQARLAVEIVHAFVARVALSGNVHHALKLAEHVGRLARGKVAAQVGAQYGFDILEAVPVANLPRVFREKQWPRIVARARKKARPYETGRA